MDLSNHPAIEPGQRPQNEPACLKPNSFKCKVLTSITNRIQQSRKSVGFFSKGLSLVIPQQNIASWALICFVGRSLSYGGKNVSIEEPNNDSMEWESRLLHDCLELMAVIDSNEHISKQLEKGSSENSSWEEQRPEVDIRRP